MIIDIKNMFNGFYPRDISNKVRSTLRAKQADGQFIGAFACYGYKKSPKNHNKLIIDNDAAEVVKQIYALYISGVGQNTIAKLLNASSIPCPSEYKKLQGLNYKNGNRLNYTTYWTYSSIRHILKNEMYTGCMVQNKSFRTKRIRFYLRDRDTQAAFFRTASTPRYISAKRPVTGGLSDDPDYGSVPRFRRRQSPCVRTALQLP